MRLFPVLFLSSVLLGPACLLPGDGGGGKGNGGGDGGGGAGSCSGNAECGAAERCNLGEDGQGRCMEPTVDDLFMCGADRPCPTGQFCFNGLCAIGCLSDGDCASNQYCDTAWSGLCLNREVPGCSSDAECAPNQVCRSGLCSAQSVPTRCTPRIDGEDGCDTTSICLDPEDTGPACVSFPPCPADGVCPVGQVGSVCNEGDIPQKSHICLTGLCKVDSNCPARWQCLQPGGGTLGLCSDGSLGMPCLATADCGSGLSCTAAAAGMIGFCTPGGAADCAGSGGSCIDMTTGASCPAGSSIDVSLACESVTLMCCV